jgi:hypothetical protein
MLFIPEVKRLRGVGSEAGHVNQKYVEVAIFSSDLLEERFRMVILGVVHRDRDSVAAGRVYRLHRFVEGAR